MKKTVTEKVLKANRENARRSSGPKTMEGKAFVRGNAIKHRVLAKSLSFKDEDEKLAFKSFIRQLAEDVGAANLLEYMLVEEIAVSWHRHARALRWEQRLYPKHNPATGIVLDAIRSNHGLLGTQTSYGAEPESSWECAEVVVSGGKREDIQRKNAQLNAEDDKQSNIELRAKFTNPMDTVLRYQKSIMNDIYRALGKLRGEQRRRRKIQGDQANSC